MSSPVTRVPLCAKHPVRAGSLLCSPSAPHYLCCAISHARLVPIHTGSEKTSSHEHQRCKSLQLWRSQSVPVGNELRQGAILGTYQMLMTSGTFPNSRCIQKFRRVSFHSVESHLVASGLPFFPSSGQILQSWRSFYLASCECFVESYSWLFPYNIFHSLSPSVSSSSDLSLSLVFYQRLSKPSKLQDWLFSLDQSQVILW